MSSNFWKNGVLFTVVGLVMRGSAVFLGAFISRNIGAEGIGLYTIIMTVYSFAVTFATSGINLTVTRLVASAVGEGRPEGAVSVVSASIIYSLSFSMIATLGLFIGADFLGGIILSDNRTIIAIRVLSLSLIPVSLSAVLSGYFVGVKRVSSNAVMSVVCQLLKIIITVAVVYYLAPYGMVKMVIGICACVTVTEILGFLLIFFEFLYDRRKHTIKTFDKSVKLSTVSRAALPLAFSSYVRSVLLNIEHILIPRKLRERGESGVEAYAHYGSLHGMALPLITYPMSPLTSFSSLLVPEFAEDLSAGRRERMNRIASKAINTTLSYSVICALLMFFFSENLGYVIYNSYEAGYYISVLAIVVPIMYLDHVTDSMLKGIGEQVFSMWVNITDSFLSVLLVCLLIPRMGIMGYAVVIVAMEGYNFLFSVGRLMKKITLKIDVIGSLLIPCLSTFLAIALSKIAFKSDGNTASSILLIMQVIFAISIVVFVLSGVEFIKKCKKQLS